MEWPAHPPLVGGRGVSLILIIIYISSHNNVMLLISCHAIYIFFSFILCFMLANTLKMDMGNNCIYPNVLSLNKTMISICMTQTGPL